MANRKPLSPSQIAKLQEMFGASLRKVNPFSDEAQDLIENHWDELRDELEVMSIAAINCVLERMRNVIVHRHVKKVNRSRTPQEALDALNRRRYTDDEVVMAMPRGQGEGAVIYFLPVDRNISSNDDLEKEYQSNGWVAADPYSVAAVNEEYSVFADEHPNFAHWKNAQGQWCYLACDRDDGECNVFVRRDVRVWYSLGWSGDSCVAVVRKPIA